MKNWSYFITLLTLVLICTMVESSFAQVNLYGSSTDQIFTKVIPDGNGYYVLGQEGTNATITRIDNNGGCQWNRVLALQCGLTDGIITPNGGLLFVGITLPFDNLNQSIVGQIDANGIPHGLKSYDSPGNESITGLVQLSPTNYLAVGHHTNASVDVVLYDITISTTDCNIVRKQQHPDGGQDYFNQDMLIPSPGSYMICGSNGNNDAIIWHYDLNGNQAGGVLGPDLYRYIDIELASGNPYNILAAANSIGQAPPYIARFDEFFLPIWERQITGLNFITQIITDLNGDIYVVGNSTALNRYVVIKLDDQNGASTPSFDWPDHARYLDNQATPYYSGFLANIPTGLVYVDGRSTPNGLGLNDGFLAITNSDMLDSCTDDIQLDIIDFTTSLSGPATLDSIMEYDVPDPHDELLSELSCAKLPVCAIPCQADYTFQYENACGLVSFTNHSTGAPNLTYCWDFEDDGIIDSYGMNPIWQYQISPCQSYKAILIVKASDGCTDTYWQHVQITESIPPIITCPPDVILACQDDTSTGNTGFAIATDNCTAAISFNYVESISGDLCNLVIERNWSATDHCNNTSYCTQYITVVDNVPPDITNCPVDLTINVPGTNPPCQAQVVIFSPIAIDDCDQTVDLKNSHNNTSDASGLYPNGTTVIVWTAKDDCGNSKTCSFTVTVVCQAPCLPACQINSLNVSTGFRETNLSQPGHIDYKWLTISAPAAVASQIGPLPRDSYIIGSFGNSWANSTPPTPTSLWISAYPFNNYTDYNCPGQSPDCNTCEPFVYERQFCICDDDVVNFNLSLLCDDAAEIEVWDLNPPSAPSWKASLGSTCGNPIDVNSPLIPLVVNSSLPLTAGTYSLRIKHWNFVGEPMGVNLLGSVTGQYLIKDECCSTYKGGFWVKKFSDTNCNGSYEWDVAHWTTNEPGMSGWTFTATNNSAPCPLSPYTEASNGQGQAFFLDVCNGTYDIAETVQPGWICTSHPTAIQYPINAPVAGLQVAEFGNCPCVRGQDIIVNGDFSGGTNGFTSDYQNDTPLAPVGSGAYSVTSGVQISTNGVWNCVDNTTGSNTMPFLAVNGGLTTGLVAWRQAVTVNPSTLYTFKAFFNNLYIPTLDESDPEIEIWIVDGNNIPKMLYRSFILPESPDQWVPWEKTWVSPTVPINPYRLEIRVISAGPLGNDFAIDDISFVECAGPQLLACGDFESMYIRTESASFSQQIFCGGSGVILGCKANEGFVVTGKVAIEIDSNGNDVPMEWVLIGPGLYFSGTTTVLDGFFDIQFLPNYFVRTGDYRLQLTTNCSNGSNLCSINLLVNCPILCSCDPQNIEDLQNNVNNGFAQILFSNSCEACFLPTTLTDCEVVEWYLENPNSTPIGVSTGNQSFCYTFPDPGAYTVVMEVKRLQPDGSSCASFAKYQNVNILCQSAPICDQSVFRNPTFSEEAESGGLSSEGNSTNWKGVSGEPIVLNISSIGSQDAWTVFLSGNLDTADVLSTIDPICLAKDTGTITLRLYGEPIPGADVKVGCKPHWRNKIIIYKGDDITYPLGDELSFEVASVALPPTIDSNGWYDLIVPYNLRKWIAQDTCGDPNVSVNVRLAVFIQNDLGTIQGGLDNRAGILIDHICVDGETVATHNPTQSNTIRIYPNPTTGMLSIELPIILQYDISLQVISLTGQQILNQIVEPGINVQAIDAGTLPQGMYFLQVISKGQVIAVNKFVKQ